MKIAIHQIEHMPWLGYFHKMSQADVYVLFDNVQYSKNNWQNRNLFSNRKGEIFWLTVPVKKKGHLSKTMRLIEIDYTKSWIKKYWDTLQMNYSKSLFFNNYAPEIRKILYKKHQYLYELNFEIINFFRNILEIKNKIIFSSELNAKGTKSELLINICKELGAATYIAGQGSKSYLDTNLFFENKIEVVFNHFQKPEYNSCSNQQVNLSALDILFNIGTKVKQYMML